MRKNKWFIFIGLFIYLFIVAYICCLISNYLFWMRNEVKENVLTFIVNLDKKQYLIIFLGDLFTTISITGKYLFSDPVTEVIISDSAESNRVVITEPQAAVENKDMNDIGYKMGSSAVSTLAGAAVGTGVKYSANKVLVGNLHPNKKYYENQYLNKGFLSNYNKAYSKNIMNYPNKFSLVVDSVVSEMTNNELNKEKTKDIIKNKINKLADGEQQ